MLECDCGWQGKENELREYKPVSSCSYFGHTGCPDCGREAEELTNTKEV